MKGALDGILERFHVKDRKEKLRTVKKEDGQKETVKLDQEKLRIMVKKSRMVYGICDQVARCPKFWGMGGGIAIGFLIYCVHTAEPQAGVRPVLHPRDDERGPKDHRGGRYFWQDALLPAGRHQVHLY